MTDRESSLSLYRIYLVFTAALMAVGTAAFSVMLGKYYDPELFGFNHSAPNSIELIIPLIFAVAFISALSTLFTMGKKAFPETTMPKIDVFTRSASVIVSLSLLLTAIFQFVFASSDDHLTFRNILSGGSEIALIHTACAVISVLAIVYFARDFISKDKSVIFGIAFVIWCALYALRVYFDMSVILSDPRRILSIVAMCSALLFIHAEFRLYTGSPMQSLYVISAMMTSVLCIISGLPSVILNVAGYFSDGIQISYFAVEASIGLYAFARLVSLASIEAFTPVEIEVEEIPEEAPAENTEEEAPAEENLEISDKNDSPLSREEIALMYSYIYNSVKERMNDSYISEGLESDEIRATTLTLLEGILKDDEGREDRIASLREA
ncbi:MAG: hypothetical protein IJF55_03185, partial [Clostridia bacterium]|nr:hypothetical protein [Clostridia bacterium]